MAAEKRSKEKSVLVVGALGKMGEQIRNQVTAHTGLRLGAALERSGEAREVLTTAEAKDPENNLLKDVRERLFPETP